MTATAGHDDSDSTSNSTPEIHPTKITRTWFPTNKWEQLGERVYNVFLTHFPSNRARVATLRFFGSKVGRGTVIGLGSRVLGIQQLSIGNDCAFGVRCLIDARGEIVIADGVQVGREVQLISGQHVVNSDDFGQLDAPIYIDEGARVEFRSMVLLGVHIGARAVILPCSMVRDDVEARGIVTGIPAVSVGVREASPH